MIYTKNRNPLTNAYRINGVELNTAYSIDGDVVFNKDVDYTDYSFTQKWASKGITSQDFAIYDDKVFWVSKSGNDSVPSTCYILNLNDGSQIETTTIYSGHGNSLSFDFPILYASTGYSNDKVVYVNRLSDSYVATLEKTLKLNDNSVAIDVCIDETDKTILWSHGKTESGSSTDIISKWNLSNLTDNGDGTYTPQLLASVNTPKPETLFSQTNMYFQGCTFHDGLLWYATWYNNVTGRIVAVDPTDGSVKYTISTDTTTEVEGVEFYAESEGYVMYVGFQGMMMRRYTFG